jgi:hypothetical protein
MPYLDCKQLHYLFKIIVVLGLTDFFIDFKLGYSQIEKTSPLRDYPFLKILKYLI